MITCNLYQKDNEKLHKLENVPQMELQAATIMKYGPQSGGSKIKIPYTQLFR